ncbi:MAG: PAS domain S-box protein [Gemmatimonadota bacterium]|nr:PAS domain S-box protein [Gemmatimonadota bacterium]
MTSFSSPDADRRLRAAIAASLDAFILLEAVRDASGAVTDLRMAELNHRAERLLGRPREALLGRLVTEVLPQVRETGLLARAIRVLDTGESLDEELRVSGPGIEAEWLRHQIVKLDDGLAVTSRDITEGKRVEASLRASEERYRLLVESATDGIYRIDPRGIFTYANPIASRVLGMGDGTIVGRSYLDFVRPDYRQEAIELYTRQIRQRVPVTYWEFPALRTDGREVWVGQNVQLDHRDGEVVGLAAVARDITARRAMEEALRQSEERYRFVTEHSRDMLARLTRDGRFEYVSPVCESLLGVGPADLQGRRFDELCDADDVAGLRAVHERLAARGGVETTTLRMHGRAGTPVWFETTHQAIVDDAGGAVTGFLTVSRDITERRKLEEDLRHVQKMEAVGQLAGGVAHDFNNLLTAIRGFSDVLFQSIRADDPRRADVLEICKATDRAATLTRQLLAFSRRQVMRPEPLNLNTVVADLARILQRLLGEGVTVATRLADGLPIVRADPGQMEQVLLNLALNARDAMAERGGTLTIETAVETLQASPEARHAPGRYAVLRVIDTGTGMTPEVRARLFEPFFTTKPRGRGTGLGLSMVYGIVTQSGGFITVDSAPGRGASFAIHLPAAHGAAEPARPAPRSRVVARGSGTILVAEDSEGVLVLAQRILRDAGYEVLTARDGVEALDVARHHAGEIDLLLTDVMMPRMNGGELARAFAAERPDAVIAIMSGYMDEDALRRTLDDPETPILQKPFSAASLLERVSALLVRAPAA